jgi:PAS domain S-box-containing protein
MSRTHKFLERGGAMGERIQHHDWSTTVLGPLDAWSRSLRMAVALTLRTPQPACLFWGPEQVLIYNDGYVPFLGDRHPASLGRPAAEVWADLWDTLGPINAAAFAGEAQRFEDMPFTLASSVQAFSWFTFSYTPVVDDEGEVAGLYNLVTETTDKVLAEQRMEASKQALHELNQSLEQQVAARTQERDRLWRNTQDVQLIIDGRGVLKAVSPAFTTILGWTSEDVRGRNVFDFILPDEEASQGALDQARAGNLPTFENRYRHKDGGFRWFSWVATPEADLIYASGRHITSEKAQATALAVAQDALRQSQKMEAVGQLTGGVAHDFNNLLTVIKSSTELLKRPDLPDDRRGRHLLAISSTVDRAAKLTGQLLAFARRQALQPEVFAACDSVRSLSAMMETITGAGIGIVTELPAHPCFVNADASQFDTALVNMAINARDAMDGQGRLTIRVEGVEAMPATRSSPAYAGAFVAVSIRDTGSGIPAERLEQIFEPFFTTKAVGQGTGLGLSQVYGFTKQSGGEIRVESRVGQGSVFTLYLPRATAAEQAKKTEEPEPLVDGHGTCVLVVEDNVDVGNFAVQTLTDLGYRTVLATNAQEALMELAEDADRFDVVFSDVVMPGMNGIDLAHEIRRLHHDLPVLLASGYSHVLAQNGTYGFELLHKPYSVEQLSRLLRKVAAWQRRRRVLGG